MVRPRCEMFRPCKEGDHDDCAGDKPTKPEEEMGVIYCACDCHKGEYDEED